jgi:hypothetical protein
MGVNTALATSDRLFPEPDGNFHVAVLVDYPPEPCHAVSSKSRD